MKPLYPGVPDGRSLRNALEMGYAVTPSGLAWPGNGGWTKPNGQPFPIPALLIEIASQWRPLGALNMNVGI